MLKSRVLLNLCRINVRSLTLSSTNKNVGGLASTGEKLSIPVPEGSDKPINPKLDSIVTQISSLNLIEVSELSSLLKKKLNIPETSMMMPMMGGSASNSKNTGDEDEEAAPKKVQTSFKVKLIKYDEKQKVALIKEVKSLFEGMNLVQAKKFVESIPTMVKEDVSKDEAEKLKEALTKIGAVIEIE